MVKSIYKLVTNAELSPGGRLDELRRRLRVKAWRGRRTVRVGAGSGTVELFLRNGSTDEEVVWQSFIGKQYEVPVVPGVRSAHKDGLKATYDRIVVSGKVPVIIDCGANMGASAAWFHLRYPGSAIVAVEPAPDNCRMMHANLDRFENVAIVEAGIGPDDSRSYLQESAGGDWGHRTGDEPSDTQIEIVSIDTIMARYADEKYVPFILKVDIEGAEQALFEKSWETMNRFPLIIIEPHDFCMAGQHTSSPFFKFHAAMQREFLYHYENVFSFRMDLIAVPGR